MDNIEASTCRIVAEQITIKKSLFFNLSYSYVPFLTHQTHHCTITEKKYVFILNLLFCQLTFFRSPIVLLLFPLFFSLDTAKKFLFPPSNDTMIGMSRSKRKRLYLLDYDFVNCDDCCLPI